MAAWGTGTNPSPAGLYSKTAQYNFSRYTSDVLEGLLTDIDSPEAFDGELPCWQFREWQEYMAEEVSQLFQCNYRYELLPINERVKNYNLTMLHQFDYMILN